MSFVQIDDFECDCDGKSGIGELDTKTMIYTCFRCGGKFPNGFRRFKFKEITKESFDVIMHDLECLELKNTKDNKYHYDLLKGNLEDIFVKKRNLKND